MELTINFKFRNEISKKNFSLNYCYQCSTCSSGCPIAYLTDGLYNPRKIIEEAILGLEDLLIKDKNLTIFLCSTCHKCVELCPQETQLTEIFNIIKNRSTNEGNYPEGYRLQAINIMDYGVAIPMTSAIQRRRNKLGLPDPEIIVKDELKILIKEIGLDKKLEYDLNRKNIQEKEE